MQGEGDNVGRGRGNRASRHVTVFCTTPDLRPRLGTLVPQDCVSISGWIQKKFPRALSFGPGMIST